MARNDVERIEVDRTVLAELIDLARRAATELAFADMALSDGLKWASNEMEASLMQHA